MDNFGHPIATLYFSESDGYQRNFHELSLWKESWKEVVHNLSKSKGYWIGTPIAVELIKWSSPSQVESRKKILANSWEKVSEIIFG